MIECPVHQVKMRELDYKGCEIAWLCPDCNDVYKFEMVKLGKQEKDKLKSFLREYYNYTKPIKQKPLHKHQKAILELSEKTNLKELSYREIGQKIACRHPQSVKHHIGQLQKRGLL